MLAVGLDKTMATKYSMVDLLSDDAAWLVDLTIPSEAAKLF